MRTKKIMFTNNKWGVWKTTLTYNVWKKLSSLWYKVVLVDLDHQCNLSALALWDFFLEQNLFSTNNIYKVLENLIRWIWDIDENVDFIDIENNLSILQWNISLSLYESILWNAFNEASSWLERWFVITSAINRFLDKKWLDNNIDFFLIDTNPSLSLLNKSIFLWTDYFIVPTMPDIFNFQWIENLWNFFENEKRNWNITAKILAKDRKITSDLVLDWESLFLWYIMNSYNVYAKQPIKSHKNWIEKIPEQIKEFLSLKHCKNWLVENSWKEPIWTTQDYGQLASLSHQKQKAIFEFDKSDIQEKGTLELLEKSKKEIDELVRNLIERISKW